MDTSKRNLLVIIMAVFLGSSTHLAAEVITLGPGQAQTWLFKPGDPVPDPDFWITFTTDAHVQISQHLWAWAHWTDITVEWWHLHSYFLLPSGICDLGANHGNICVDDAGCPGGTCTAESGVSITNINPTPDPIDFTVRMNTVCTAGNIGDPCEIDADCGAGGLCAIPVCQGGTNDGTSCTDNTVCTGGGFCELNTVVLNQSETFDIPIVGPLDTSVNSGCNDCAPGVLGCTACLPRIAKFWLWITQITLTNSWIEAHFWAYTDYHFITTETWHFEALGLVTGADGTFNGTYKIRIKNLGASPITFDTNTNLAGTHVPAVSEWGVAVMALLVLLGGTIVVKRQRKLAGV